MRTDPFVSIIIPSLNRKEILKTLIASLFSFQEYRSFEIVIIDQSDGYDRELLNKEMRRYGSLLRYCAVDFKGLPRARNTGIAVAKGDILLFLDDDIEIGPELIQEHLWPYFSYPRLGGVAGRVIEEADKFTNSRKAGASVSFTGRCFRNFSSERPGFVTAGPGGNISFDRRLIEDVGLFDEKFIGTSELEETDFCYRVRRKGCRIYYNPRAVIRHLVFPSGGCRSDFAQRGYYRMHNIGLFLAKHKSPWSVPAAFIFQGLTMLKRGFSARQAEAGISWSFLLWFKGLLKGYFITGKGFRSECTAHKSSISSLCGGD